MIFPLSGCHTCQRLLQAIHLNLLGNENLPFRTGKTNMPKKGLHFLPRALDSGRPFKIAVEINLANFLLHRAIFHRACHGEVCSTAIIMRQRHEDFCDHPVILLGPIDTDVVAVHDSFNWVVFLCLIQMVVICPNFGISRSTQQEGRSGFHNAERI